MIEFNGDNGIIWVIIIEWLYNMIELLVFNSVIIGLVDMMVLLGYFIVWV